MSDAERIELALRLLEQYEWSKPGGYCPKCGGLKPRGHKKNCDVARVLNPELPGAEE